MDCNKILEQLDLLFATRQFNRVEDFLKMNYRQAIEEGDVAAEIMILNELMGYYRENTQFKEALWCAQKAREIMDRLGLKGTMEYATMLLNAANAYRAAGLYDESLKCYDEVLKIYNGKLEKTDFMYATLYNNISILYQAMEDYKSAAVCLYKALDIVKLYKDSRIEQAVTYTNLGATLVKAGEIKEAFNALQNAKILFEQDETRDYHYSACMNALGEVYYEAGDYQSSALCYETALMEIKNTIGKNETYYAIKESLESVKKKIKEAELKRIRKAELEKTAEAQKIKDAQIYKMKSMDDANESKVEKPKNMVDICRIYYEVCGKPMIERLFPEYADKIAVGMVGEGSECFGFDDEISRDHDCGPGFCMWMSDEVFQKIGDELNREYNKLPGEFMGMRRMETQNGKWRTGAMSINSFYEKILEQPVPESQDELAKIEEWRLATATNGCVFVDKEGTFTKIRNLLLSYYPERVWLEKISVKLADCAQSGQYNYSRMMARGEYVTAKIALAKYMEDITLLVYLLNRKYAPYYKWMHRGIKNSTYLPEIYDILRAMADMPDQRTAWKNFVYDGNVNENDNIAMTIEIIAKLVVHQLQLMKLTTSSDLFLQNQAMEIAHNVNTKEKLIDELVLLEWKAFDKVQNEGGRADCQDDWTTFSIMRKSQYLTWTEEMIQSFIDDFKLAYSQNRNLIAEKYGRMMESTAPLEYEKIKYAFQELSPKRMKIQEEIIKIQVQWMEEFAKEYKYMAGNARSIHTYEDNLFNTSYETYLRGEISTYSEKTLLLYANFIVSLAREGKNLAKMTIENTAILYGFDSLEDAEKYSEK